MNDDIDADDPPAYSDPPTIYSRHFLTCRSIWYDKKRPEAGFSLGGIFSEIQPIDDFDFPLRLEKIYVFTQLYGDPGEYRLRIRLVKIETTEDDETEEVQLGNEGQPREFQLPSQRPVVISGIEFVEAIAFPIGPVPFFEAGLYEYQLWADGIPEPLARERILARN
jgi:hypothetical protein